MFRVLATAPVCLLLLTGGEVTAAPCEPGLTLGDSTLELAMVRPVQPDVPDWRVKSEHHLCGLSEAKQLTNPARVDLDVLMALTPEFKKIREERIREGTARYLELKQKAKQRVVGHCEAARAEGGHCSVWEEISHRKGDAVTDLTDIVKQKLQGS